MSEKRILSIDPSFKHLAFCVYNGDNKIHMDMCSYPLGEGIGFEKIFVAVDTLWKDFYERLKKLNIEITTVISEVPPPVGSFAAGLYGLDVFLLHSLWDSFPSIQEIYYVPPSYLTQVHGTSKYQKSDSTRLAKYYIDEVLKDDFSLIIPDNVSEKGRRTKGTVNNDKAESYLFLLRAFSKFNVKGLSSRIVSEMSGFGIESEKLLMSRTTKIKLGG